jgi:hypothetical protein
VASFLQVLAARGGTDILATLDGEGRGCGHEHGVAGR